MASATRERNSPDAFDIGNVARPRTPSPAARGAEPRSFPGSTLEVHRLRAAPHLRGVLADLNVDARAAQTGVAAGAGRVTGGATHGVGTGREIGDSCDVKTIRRQGIRPNRDGTSVVDTAVAIVVETVAANLLHRRDRSIARSPIDRRSIVHTRLLSHPAGSDVATIGFGRARWITRALLSERADDTFRRRRRRDNTGIGFADHGRCRPVAINPRGLTGFAGR